MFSDESTFISQSDSCRIFVRNGAPVTTNRTSLNNIVAVFQDCSFGKKYTGLQNRSVCQILTMTEEICLDIILEHLVQLFGDDSDTEIIYLNDNFRPY